MHSVYGGDARVARLFAIVAELALLRGIEQGERLYESSRAVTQVDGLPPAPSGLSKSSVNVSEK